MRLIIELSVNYYYKNLLINNEIMTIILNKYTNISHYNLILIIHEVSHERPWIYIINVIYIIYILLYYVLLFLYNNLD
jgi:hypothetical protein